MRQVRFYYDMDVDDIREKYDLSDDDEITMGIPVSCQRHPRIQDMMGIITPI